MKLNLYFVIEILRNKVSKLKNCFNSQIKVKVQTIVKFGHTYKADN